MAVRKKGHRSMVVNDESYLWFVRKNRERGHHLLHVLSNDKSMVLEYRLDAPSGEKANTKILVKSKRNSKLRKTYQFLRPSPRWDDTGPITPGIIQQMIVWALAEVQSLI